MRNIRLTIEYDGTEFVGWQVQPNGRTVQGEVSSVLKGILHEQVNLISAGRTDTGVHARGQVAHFATSAKMAVPQLLKAMNGLLPPDIRIRAGGEVPESFHSRYNAIERAYRYHISRQPIAIGRTYHWHVTYTLSVERMNEAASLVTGVHHFEAFSKSGSDVEHYRCKVSKSRWKEEGESLIYEIRSDRFVRGMVRALVGTMIDVGRGALSVSDFSRILESRDRSLAGTLAPAAGLVLEEVVY